VSPRVLAADNLPSPSFDASQFRTYLLGASMGLEME
jgi:hypothetical protein